MEKKDIGVIFETNVNYCYGIQTGKPNFVTFFLFALILNEAFCLVNSEEDDREPG